MIWCGVMLSLIFPDKEKEDNTQDNDDNDDDDDNNHHNRMERDGKKGMINGDYSTNNDYAIVEYNIRILILIVT